MLMYVPIVYGFLPEINVFIFVLQVHDISTGKFYVDTTN